MIESLWLAIRLAVAAILLVSAAAKLRAPRRFAEEVAGYRLVPAALTRPTAGAVLLLEGTAAVAVLAGVAAGVWLAAALFAAFAVAIGSALSRGLAVPCGCFGDDAPVSRLALARTGMLLAAALAGTGLSLTGPAAWPGLPDAVVALTLAGGGLMLGRLALLVPDWRAALGWPAGAPGSEPR